DAGNLRPGAAGSDLPADVASLSCAPEGTPRIAYRPTTVEPRITVEVTRNGSSESDSNRTRFAGCPRCRECEGNPSNSRGRAPAISRASASDTPANRTTLLTQTSVNAHEPARYLVPETTICPPGSTSKS